MELVKDWKSSWRWWSVQADVLLSGLITYMLASPGSILEMFQQLPSGARLPMAGVIGALLFSLKLFARLAAQNAGDEAGAEEG